MRTTIITPVLNAKETIADCLGSVRQQKYEQIEHLVIDGGSDDGTLEILDRSRIDLIKKGNEDKGIYDAINSGIDHSTGDVIGILNADDVYSDEEVVSEVMKLFSDPELDLVYGDLEYKDAFGRTVRRWQAGHPQRRKFKFGWMPPHPTVFVKKELFDKIGTYRLDLSSSGDYEFLLRAMYKYEVKSAYIPRVMVHMRTGGVSNASLQNRIRANRMDRKAWVVNDLDPGWFTHILKPLTKIGQWL